MEESGYRYAQMGLDQAFPVGATDKAFPIGATDKALCLNHIYNSLYIFT